MFQIAIRIDKELRRDFNNYCDSIGESMSDVIKKFVMEFIDDTLPPIEIEDFFYGNKKKKSGGAGGRLNVRVDKEIKDKFFFKCERLGIPSSFILRNYVTKCANMYNALDWLSDKKNAPIASICEQ